MASSTDRPGSVAASERDDEREFEPRLDPHAE